MKFLFEELKLDHFEPSKKIAGAVVNYDFGLTLVKSNDRIFALDDVNDAVLVEIDNHLIVASMVFTRFDHLRFIKDLESGILNQDDFCREDYELYD